MKNDAELLAEFASRQAQDAFAELVRRHIDLVYSAALRQVGGDRHLAHDVVQLVFAALARKAGTLGPQVSVAGWLYKGAHYAAANAVRAERRRRIHEREAQAMREINHETDASADWARVGPVLDAAMLELGETDREAVLRRFFSAQSFAEIGGALRMSEDTARKRVARALDKLQRGLARRGVSSASAALTVALSQHAVVAAPAGLSAAVSEAAVSGAAVAAGASVGAGSLILMNKFATGLAVAATLALLTTTAVLYRERSQVRDEIDALRQRRDGAMAAIATAERRGIELRAQLDALPGLAGARSAAGEAGLPARAVPATPRRRAGLDESYASLFRRLQLSEAKLDGLKDLLVEREATERDVRRFAEQQGLPTNDLSLEEWSALVTVAASEVDARIRTLLGDDRYDYCETFLRTLRYRRPFTEAAGLLSLSSAPLRDDQIDQLTAWAVELASDSVQAMPIFRGTWVSDELMRRAESILSPLQLRKLELVRARDSAVAQLQTMNRAAAEKGLLRLTAQSARDYPSRGGSAGKP